MLCFHIIPLCQLPYSIIGADTGVWTKVITTSDGPSARFSVAGDCLDPVKGGVLVFLGGCNKSLEALDDMYYLYTGFACSLHLPHNYTFDPTSCNIWFWEWINTLI